MPDFDIHLGDSQIGLALTAQLVSGGGSDVGPPITTGFSEIGGGIYLWSHNLPAGFRGGVKFAKSDGTFMTFTSVNPSAAGELEIEDGVNLRQAVSAMAAALAGVIQGSGEDVTIKAIGHPDRTRIVSRANESGERSAVTLTFPS